MLRTKRTLRKLRESFQGKVFLIGLTFIDHEGKLIEQFQTHGVVVDLTEKGLFKIEKKDGDIFQVPYKKNTMWKADKGEYREIATGDIIIDPDFIMTWEITTSRDNNLDEVKKNGYVPSNLRNK
jgi:hypothetical protein